MTYVLFKFARLLRCRRRSVKRCRRTSRLTVRVQYVVQIVVYWEPFVCRRSSTRRRRRRRCRRSRSTAMSSLRPHRPSEVTRSRGHARLDAPFHVHCPLRRARSPRWITTRNWSRAIQISLRRNTNMHWRLISGESARVGARKYWAGRRRGAAKLKSPRVGGARRVLSSTALRKKTASRRTAGRTHGLNGRRRRRRRREIQLLRERYWCWQSARCSQPIVGRAEAIDDRLRNRFMGRRCENFRTGI